MCVLDTGHGTRDTLYKLFIAFRDYVNLVNKMINYYWKFVPVWSVLCMCDGAKNILLKQLFDAFRCHVEVIQLIH